MNITISHAILFKEAKQWLKQDIIGRLKFALDKKCDYISKLREDVGRLQKYAESYATLETLHKAFVMLDDDKEFASFRAHYFNTEYIEILETSGVEKTCLSDLEFYLRLIDEELDNSITVKPVLARVSDSAVEVKIKVYVGGLCYENEGGLKDFSDSSSDTNNVSTNGSNKTNFHNRKVDGKNGHTQ